MTELRIESVRSSPTGRSVAARRVRFVSHPLTGTRIRRSFKHPRACLAVEQNIDLAELLRPEKAEETSTLDIVFVTPEARAEWERMGSAWLGRTSEADSPEPVMVAIPATGDVVRWRPGRAVVEGTGGLRDDVLAGLIEFAFLEGEVRALEREIERYESQARADAPRTFRINHRHQEDWVQFGDAIENLAQLRLTFATLEPRVAKGSRVLTQPGRQLATRLFRAAATADRMEGLDGRLEACEDLYEGAVDRIADYRGWSHGHRLEVIIIVLLLIEACLMTAELLYRG